MSANASRLGLKIVAIVAVLAVGAAVTLYSLRPVANVKIVKSGMATDIVPGTVVVTPVASPDIKTEAEGKLKEFNLKIGDVVKKGDVVAKLDATDIETDIRHYTNDLAAAKETNDAVNKMADIQWKSTEEDMAYNKKLAEGNSLSVLAFTRMKRDFERAEENKKLIAVQQQQAIEGLEYKLATLKLARDRTVVTATIDGVVSSVFAHEGDLVGNKQTLGTLITEDRHVIGKISEERFADVKLGQKATVTFLGRRGGIYHAVVKQKLPTAEEATQRYLVYLDVVDISPELLTPSLTGEVGIVVGEHQAPALVEQRAIFEQNHVFVVENGRVVKRTVKLGFASLTVTEVLEGLKPGDQVIVDDLDKFSEGDRVSVKVVN